MNSFFPGLLSPPLFFDDTVFVQEGVVVVLADVTALALSKVGLVELLEVHVGTHAAFESIVELKEFLCVFAQLAGFDVLEALRAASLEPNAARGKTRLGKSSQFE